MQSFDRDDRSLIEQQIDRVVNYPELGRVTQVYEHLKDNDDSNFEVDVQTAAGKRIPRVPVETASGNGISVPTVGDKVVVAYRANGDEPYVITRAFTNEERPPIGRAGMWRQSFESGQSPAGSGDLYVTGHTRYSSNPASVDPDLATPEESIVRIAKRDNQVPEPTTDSPDAAIEFHDRPADNESTITIEIRQANGSDSNATWGIEFNIGNGTFTLCDPDGFGIEASGNGDFTWYYNNLTESELNQSTGPLNIE